jgi:cytochrome P450
MGSEASVAGAPPSALEVELLELLSPAGRADPYPIYARIRERGRVQRSVLGPLVVTGYEECLLALRDPRLGRGTSLAGDREPPSRALFGPGLPAELVAEFRGRAGRTMLFADPPDHTRLRRLVSRAFTPARVEALRPAVAALAEELLSEMAGAREVDVMSTLAFPLPVRVIGALLGVPREDQGRFQGLVRKAAALLEPALTPEQFHEGIAAHEEMRAYFEELFAARRREPADDLVTALAQAAEDGDRLSHEEAVATAVLLFAAGFETTTNLVGNGLLALLRHPAELRRWREDPGLSKSAVEELLRFDSPVQVNARVALQPAELGGFRLEPGDAVIVLIGAGNHDPERFGDPDRLDLGRPDTIPLSFGGGIHYCLGAPLARLEAEVVFPAMLARFPRIELATEELEWRPLVTLRGLASLPVRLG